MKVTVVQRLVAVICLLVAASLGTANAADVGDPAFFWQYLPGTDGRLHSLKDYHKSKFVVVAFLCNKCPCVKGYESRFKRLSQKYAMQGITFVGINSSIGAVENMETMKQRASLGKYNFDYLRDANQTTARGFRAMTTPHVFILNQDRRIVYSGAFDNNRTESRVTQHYVINSLEALLAGKPVPVAKTSQFGCTITYRR